MSTRREILKSLAVSSVGMAFGTTAGMSTVTACCKKRSTTPSLYYPDVTNVMSPSVSYNLGSWLNRWMQFRSTAITIYSNGEFRVTTDTKNNSPNNGARYYVWYGFRVVGASTQTEVFRVTAWEGYFGAQYQEVKVGTGTDLRLANAYHLLSSNQYLIGPWSTVQQKN